MKKKIIIFIFICILTITSIAILIAAILKQKESIVINLDKFSEGIYYKKIDGYINDYTIINNNYYYATNFGQDLHRLDLSTKEDIFIGKIETENTSCGFEQNLYKCIDDENITYYALDLTEKAKITLKDIEDETLYYSASNKIQAINLQKIEKDLDVNYYLEYLVIEDNLYILFRNYEKEKFIIYNYNTKEKKEVLLNNYFIFEEGFIFEGTNEYVVYNLKNNTTTKIKKIASTIYSLTYMNDLIIALNQYTKAIMVFDLNNQTVSIIDDLQLENLYKFKHDNKYLYSLYDGIDKSTIYIFDLQNINYQTTMSLDEYDKYIQNLNNDLIKILKNDYYTTINIKDKKRKDYVGYTFMELDDDERIHYTLNSILNVFNKLDKEFFKAFKQKDRKGLEINIVDGINSTDEYGLEVASGLTYVEDDTYVIQLKSELVTQEGTVCHELFHSIENSLNYNHDYFFPDWYDLNPKKFIYIYNYTNEYLSKEKYTYSHEDNKENVYFIDNYALTYPTEDRARIFEKICNEDNEYFKDEYIHLNKKKDFIIKSITDYYPSLKDIKIFN